MSSTGSFLFMPTVVVQRLVKLALDKDVARRLIRRHFQAYLSIGRKLLISLDSDFGMLLARLRSEVCF